MLFTNHLIRLPPSPFNMLTVQRRHLCLKMEIEFLHEGTVRVFLCDFFLIQGSGQPMNLYIWLPFANIGRDSYHLHLHIYAFHFVVQVDQFCLHLPAALRTLSFLDQSQDFTLLFFSDFVLDPISREFIFRQDVLSMIYRWRRISSTRSKISGNAASNILPSLACLCSLNPNAGL